MSEYLLVGSFVYEASIKNLVWCSENRLIDPTELNLPKEFKVIQPSTIGLTCEAEFPVSDFLLVDRVLLFVIARGLDLCASNAIGLKKVSRKIEI